ncbi:radical SAM domain protein [Ammonifex degensii KC4]|uniref:Radical SAM domain protein n=1 Tax=Ammonifex degensii (strain DSM 10501 / KC4) TaxID=429009 RepID=C9RC79_AMMDK|nr:radical SAM domain protein [Ammonifex degensii KC4]
MAFKTGRRPADDDLLNLVFRRRKSPFVRLFTKTPPGVVCPHFYELILSNGCPYDCVYCYLRLTFRGNKHPVLFTNSWEEVHRELDACGDGVFSTGELADSLAVVPPLLAPAVEYFRARPGKYLLLTTKSCNTAFFRGLEPTPQVIVSFSVNAPEVAERLERLAPPPLARLKAAAKLMEWGWRVRVRLDPVVWDGDLSSYRSVCREIRALGAERVTVGTLRQYPGLFRFAPGAPRKGLHKASDGRMRYSLTVRLGVYERVAEWLGVQPALCKETEEVWQALGWTFCGCNCTV